MALLQDSGLRLWVAEPEGFLKSSGARLLEEIAGD